MGVFLGVVKISSIFKGVFLRVFEIPHSFLE